MKKIVFLTWNTKRNGGNILNFKFAEILKNKGFDCRVVTFLKSRGNWSDLEIEFQTLASYLWHFSTPDILIATFWPTAFLAFLLPAKEKIYFVRNWETNFYRFSLLRLLVLATFKLPFNKIFTISKFLKDKIAKVSSSPIFLIPDPIDIKVFKPAYLKNKKRNKNPIILSVVSNYGFYKGMDGLVKVVKELKKKRPDLRFVLISFEKKPFSLCFDKFISNPSLKELVSWYQKADVFLSTSLTEGFPLPPREAMACGLPVVATDSGGINEYAKNNFNAIIEKDIEAILAKRKIEEVLTNQKLRNRLIRNGLKTARKYSWKNSIHLLEKFLNI